MSDWAKMDQWEMVLPPSRPTVVELNRIEKYINCFSRNDPIAILGSTPEFRDLLFRMGFQNRYIFDKSVDYYYRMSKLLPTEVSQGESLIEGDWLLTLSQYTNSFKVVLSDLTMGNIVYEKRKMFYKLIADTLFPGGVFIDKVLAFDFTIPTIEQLFNKYEQLPINLRTINDFSSEVLFCSELVATRRQVDSTELYNYIDNGPFSSKIKYFSKAARMITPEGFLWDYGVPWSELVNDYETPYRSQICYPNEDPESAYYKRTKQFFNCK